jgi:integrase
MMVLQKTILSTSLEPIEKLTREMIPNSLSGQVGENRAPQSYCQLDADDDLTAVRAWLAEFNDKLNTYRVYQKEAERLLLWCFYQQQKPLSSLRREDFDAYTHFLSDPQPRALWCGSKGGRGHTRGAPSWRPFMRGLGQKSITMSLTIINSLLEYLKDAGYLMQNPLKLMKRLARGSVSFEERQLEVKARVLEPEEWQALQDTLECWPVVTDHDRQEKERLKLIMGLLFYLGLRVGELTTHTWAAFRNINGLWWFVVRGKGNKLGKIPVAGELWQIVLNFRGSMGMALIPTEQDQQPLIPSWLSEKGLQARQVNNLLKKLGEEASKQFLDQPAKVKKLKKISAHWLRHQSATAQSQVGISEEHIQLNHRHSKRETTRIYIHTPDQARHEAMQGLSIKIKPIETK